MKKTWLAIISMAVITTLSACGGSEDAPEVQTEVAVLEEDKIAEESKASKKKEKETEKQETEEEILTGWVEDNYFWYYYTEDGEYPEADCTLDYAKPHELLFSVRLAAQCTDERVNQVTPALFARYPTLEDFAAADVSEVEQYVHSCGFYHAKARDIVACSKVLLEKYNGQVPSTMEELTTLPGVEA